MQGSYTVELAAIMPAIMLVLILAVTLTFYCYDKCILSGIAAEAAVASAEEIRWGNDTKEVLARAKRAAKDRMLLFGSASASLAEDGDSVTVTLQAKKASFPAQCEAKASACIKEAEGHIRLYRLLKSE